MWPKLTPEYICEPRFLHLRNQPDTRVEQWIAGVVDRRANHEANEAHYLLLAQPNISVMRLLRYRCYSSIKLVFVNYYYYITQMQQTSFN